MNFLQAGIWFEMVMFIELKWALCKHVGNSLTPTFYCDPMLD